MISYCIIDDEPIAHRIIEGYCSELPNLQKKGNAFNAFEASALVTKQKVDLIFLDMNMPKMSGFEWLKTLRIAPQIIVTSAYKEYALEGYEFDIVDYLLKPFSLQRFLKAVNKISTADKESVSSTENDNSSNKREIFIKGDKKHHLIHLDNILFIEAYGNYTKVVMKEETIITHKTISSIEKLLPLPEFLRVHKSFVIATKQIKTVEGNRIKIKETLVPIGQTYKQQLSQLIDK